jgi:hypothetical protein
VRASKLGVIAALWLASAAAQASVSPNDYTHRWPLTTAGEGAAFRFEPGAEVLAALQDPEWGDLQVFDAIGAAMPIARLAPQRTVAPQWAQARFLSGGPADGPAGDAGVMRYDYRLPASLVVDAARLRLVGAQRDLNLTVQYRKDAEWVVAARMRVTGAADIALPQPVTTGAWRVISGLALSPAPVVDVAWRPQAFVFLAAGQAPYLLAAGHATARRDHAADGKVLTAAGARPALARVGARSTAPFQAASPAARERALWQRLWPWLLGAGVAVGAAWLLPRRRKRST